MTRLTYLTIPERSESICHRGLKRVERKMEHTKSFVSLMFCGNATGEYLPPMVVYKSQNVYQEWMRGGPRGAVYDCTPSGWFDSRCFERWFTEIFLTNVSKKPGRKVLIGDNLSAHFTPDVIKASLENDVAFVTLIPNSTHLLQPLDVAVFRPAKIKWRQILEGWRKESRYRGVLPKNHFPDLLLKLHNSLNPENLVAGFKATVGSTASAQAIARC
jgi:DDE superfamily endonuclease